MLDTNLVGLVGLILLLIFVFSGIPVGAVMGMIGFAGLVLIIGIDAGLGNLAVVAWNVLNSYELAVIPLFLVMGIVVGEAQIGTDAFEAAIAWVGQIRGGLAMATIVACGLFAAVCGSSLATTVAMGKVAFPEMKRVGYDLKLAVGSIAAGGCLGILIPPSLPFIMIGILTSTSIGKLFMAGIIPGIIQIIFYCITIFILCKFNPLLGPGTPKTTFRQKTVAFRLTWPIVVLFMLVIGGIYGGVFTPSEAGGIGAFGAITLGLIRRRLSFTKISDSFFEAIKTTAMLLTMLVGAFIFMRFLALSEIPYVAGKFIGTLGLSPYITLVIVLIFYIILGMFIDAGPVIVLTTPIIFPIMISLGFDPVWWGVLMVVMCEMGYITPPFGINLFAITATSGEPLEVIYRGVIPFCIADLFFVALLVVFPELSLFLPNLMI